VLRAGVGLSTERDSARAAAEAKAAALQSCVAAPLTGGQARHDLRRRLADQVTAWQDSVPAGALYVSCIGRGRRFHGVPGLETAYIQQHLGPLPVAGFFSGAEIAPGSSFSRLHQYTGVLAMLGPGT
jgi:small ligand-binding sensory domain FIST